MTYLLDSNILIYHLNGELEATLFLTTHLNQSAISVITYLEVLSFDFTKEEEAKVRRLLEKFPILEVTKEIGDQAVRNRKEKKIKVPDNLIGATAQVHGLTLVTRNTSDFLSLPLRLIDPLK